MNEGPIGFMAGTGQIRCLIARALRAADPDIPLRLPGGTEPGTGAAKKMRSSRRRHEDQGIGFSSINVVGLATATGALDEPQG